MMNETIQTIATAGKGILAADESIKTATKRLESVGVEATQENRRRYRELLFSTPEVENHIAGVILFEETLAQSTSEGTPFPQYLQSKGIIPGIKVDGGLKNINDTEQVTQGIDTLKERLQNYKEHGPKFAKWRAVYHISDTTPSQEVIDQNAKDLAAYAKICQEEDIVPIVEPEVLINGSHSIERCKEVSRAVLKKVFEEIAIAQVDLAHMILKPSMVISGLDATDRADVKSVASNTLDVLKETVPSQVPTINFLSGGQSPQEATAHLQAMHDLGDLPWNLSFSYARAVQEPALDAWKGEDANKDQAQQAFLKRAKLNGLASMGKYTTDLESE